VLGGVFSGEIEAVGAGVQRFAVGDRVFGSTMDFGAHAEYICVPETAPLAVVPDGLDHEAAAALPFGGITALHFLQKAGVRPGQKVLIYGASGAVGTAAVQLAKYFGAEVTAVCSTANLELVRSLGADHVIDYTRTDFARTGQRYDVVYETVGKAPYDSCLAALTETGTLILGAGMLGALRGIWTQATSRRRVIAGVALPTVEAVGFLQKLVLEGRLKAVIDQKYALEQIAAAHQYVDLGHKKGNVVIVV
jgi:NADPH:quinone reductase-like Zn-dependent oxidoreductase